MFLTLMPGRSMPDLSIWDFFAFDKAVHASVYAVLVFLLIIGFTKQHTLISLRFRPKRHAFIAGLAYGLLLELIQIASPGRSFEYLDIAANSTGCLLGLLLFFLIYKT